MDLTRLRLGELLAGCAAVALLVSLFFAWNLERDGQQSGWEALGVVVLVLLLLAVALALGLVFATITKRPAAIPIGTAVVTTFVGTLVALVLALRIVFLDDSEPAAYLGLLAAFLIPVGGWITMADERTDAPYSAAPDLPRRPAPPVEA